MLGRNGYETEYVELAVFGSDQEAEEALTVFLKEIEELEDYKVGNIELYKNPGAPQFLTIRQDWKSKHTIRFITDGDFVGIMVKPKKVKSTQVYYKPKSTRSEETEDESTVDNG